MLDISEHDWTNMIISSLKQAILSALADEEIVKILNCSMYRAFLSTILLKNVIFHIDTEKLTGCLIKDSS
jgi:hypothetical protein